MDSKFIRPSPFWVAARRLVSIKFLITLIVIGALVEVVARLSPVIVARTVHQPYLVSKRICEIDCTNLGRPVTWMANERGTRGELYHGQPLRIAVFGSSTTAGVLLDQQQSWPEQLVSALGRDRVHIDNYARTGATHREATTILEHIGEEGPAYDVVLIMMHLSTADAMESGVDDRFAFHYWGKWVLPDERLLVSPKLVRWRISAQLKSEPRTEAAWRWLSTAIRGDTSAPPRPSMSRSNRKLRNSGQVKLVDDDVSFTDEEVQSLRERTREMLAAAESTGAHVYLLSQPIAFDEDEVPEVARRWYTLRPVEGQEGAYLSNRSYASGLREINRIMLEEAEARGTASIDLDGEIQPMLRERGDLFDDKWHFAPAGAAVAATLVADHLLAADLGLGEITTRAALQRPDAVRRVD